MSLRPFKSFNVPRPSQRNRNAAFVRRPVWFSLFSVAFGLGTTFGVGAAFSGCSSFPSEPKPNLEVGTYQTDAPNPLFIQTNDSDYLWNAIVDVVDNYFEIEYETPIRVFDKETASGRSYSSRTEGRVDTKPSIAAGVFEPWRKNSTGCDQRWEATFQTIRRKAVVRVVPDGAGFLVYLAVYNEIEDMPRPMGSKVGVNMSFSDDLTQVEQTGSKSAKSKGWIPLGRDAELETRMLQEIAWRLGNPPTIMHSPSKLVP